MTRPSLIALVLLAPVFSCVKPKAGGSSSTQEVTISAAPDAELFAGNDKIAVPLQQEIKRQLLASVELSKILREVARNDGNLLLREIGILRTGSTVSDVDLSVDAKVTAKQQPVGEGFVNASGNWRPDTGTMMGNGSVSRCAIPNQLGMNSGATFVPGSISTSTYGERGTTGASANAQFVVASSTYNISFAFIEKSSGKEEVYRFHLAAPLTVEEVFCVSSRVKLSLNAINALPPPIKTLVNRFIDDISLAIDGGMWYQRTSEVSSQLYFKENQAGITPFTRSLVSDIVRPLCLKVAASLQRSTTDCDIPMASAAPSTGGVANRIPTAAQPVQQCEKTGLTENFLPLFKLYFEAPAGAQVYLPKSKAYLFKKVEGGWRRESWATVEGAVSESHCPKMAAGSQCLLLKAGGGWLAEQCSAITQGELRLAVFHEDSRILMDIDTPQTPVATVQPFSVPTAFPAPTALPVPVATYNWDTVGTPAPGPTPTPWY